MSSSRIVPEEGRYHRSSNPTSVLFPLPDGPTIAVVLPAGMETLRSRNTAAPGRDGYAKFNPLIWILPSHPMGRRPDSSRGSSCDFLSMIPNSSEAAPEAFVKAVMVGLIDEIDVAAIRVANTTLGS